MALLPWGSPPPSRKSVYSPASYVVGPLGSGRKADYYTDGTNDEVQINAAIVAANALATGGTIYVMAGTYSISSSIVPKSNVRLEGESINSTILAGQAGLTNTSIMSVTATALSPLTNFTVANIKLDGTNMPSTSNTALKGINIVYSLNCKFENVYCYNTPATGFGPDFMVQGSFTNCVADTCGRMAGDPGYNGFGQGTGGYANESIQYVNCIAVNCGNNGFLIERQFGAGFVNEPRDYQFTNCYAIGCKRGFRNSSCAGSIFVNCIAVNSTSDGFHFETIAAASPPIDATVIGCSSYGNTGTGINIGIDDSRVANAIVTGCRSFNNGAFGIRCGGDKVEVKDNVTYGNTQSGIRVHPTSTNPIEAVKVTGNTSFNNSEYGISVSGGTEAIVDAVVDGNVCFDDQVVHTQINGINVLGTVSNLHVGGNITHTNTQVGLLINNDSGTNIASSNVVVCGNISYNNAQLATSPNNVGIQIWGVNASGPLSNVLVYGNRAYDNQGTQTQVTGLQIKDYVTIARISGNDFSGNLTNAILNSAIDDSTIIYENNIGVSDVVTKAVSYTLTSLDKVILGDTTATNRTMTLPTAVNRNGRVFTIKKIAAANTLTIATTSAQTIDGSSTVSVTVNNTSLDLISDGSNWRVK